MILVVAYQRFSYYMDAPWIANPAQTPPQVTAGSGPHGAAAAAASPLHCAAPGVGMRPARRLTLLPAPPPALVQTVVTRFVARP